MVLQSPGVEVTVTDESQYAITSPRDTIPLILLATHQDKATPDGSATAAFTTEAQAGELKLITSPRELVQNFGNPVFYDVNGTVQQGYELNEYGLLAAYKTLNVANRVYVMRGDIDLAQLVPSSTAPAGDPLANTYWFDLSETEFGIFQYENDAWVHVDPTLVNDTTNMTGAAPSNGFGKNGDIAVVTVNNATTQGQNRVYEKLGGVWYQVGSDSWDAASSSVANGSTVFTSASSQTLSGLPQAGDNLTIDVNNTGSPVSVTLTTPVTSTANMQTANTLALKTFIANSSTVTLGTTSGANITGTTDYTTNTEQTGASVGDIVTVTDTAGSDAVTLRIKVTGSGGSFGNTDLGGTLVINGASIALSGEGSAAALASTINGVVGSAGTDPQGITASDVGGEVQLIKDTAVSGENNANQIDIDISSVTGVDVTGFSTGTTNLDVQEVVESFSDQINSSTDNLTATVNGGGPYNVRIADSATGLTLTSTSGTPLTDLGMPTNSAVPLADIETEIEAGVANTEVDAADGTDVPAAGQGLLITFSGTGDFTIGSGTANTELGFTAGGYRVSLNQIVSQFNTAAPFVNTTASVVTSGTSNRFRITNTDSYELDFSGAASTKLGLPSTVTESQLFYSTHASVPSNPQEGDIWIKTTSPNLGANWVVKYWDTNTGQWVLSSAPLYESNADAFDAYSTDLSAGDLFVKYDVDDANYEASHVIYRYNGEDVLELDIATADFTGSAQTILVGNGRATPASVTVSSLSAFVSAINGLGQDNLEAELTSGGAVIRNTAGEDIVLNDDTATVAGTLGGDYTAGRYSNWVALRLVTIGSWTGYVPSTTAPSTDPEEGELWYNADLSLSDIDLLINDDGSDQWITFTGDIQISATKPTTQADGTSALQEDDIWVNSANLDDYPVIYRWNNLTSKWVLVDNTDQTTPDGILFADARPDASSNLDPDAPNPLAYPAGMLLWNTRASSLVVKEYRANWFGDETGTGESFDGSDYTQSTYDIGNDTFAALSSAARWVTVSGNKTDGSPYMGRKAQRIMIVEAMASAISSNEDVRDIRRNFFNLVLCPGYPELIDELVTLNLDRKETAFIITDVPKRLTNNSTEVQDWILNADNAASTGEDGLTTNYTYSAIYYPPLGLTTNLDGNEVAMPSSLGALYAYLYNDNVSYPWFAPAGVNRGLLSGIFASLGYLTSEEEYKPAQISRGLQDTLYVNKVNPIVYQPTRGWYVNGQKTLHPSTSALDRVNVARLIVYLRYQLELLAEEFLFEINDNITRDQVKNTFDRFFGDLLGLRAIYDFLVVCDESNNTPERIDRNELWIDVAIQPAKAIEFIYIPIRIKNTGEDLTN